MKKLTHTLTASLLLAVLVLTGSCGDREEPLPPSPTKTVFSQCRNTMSFYSNKLRQKVRFDIVLPKEYLTGSEANYDVLYLLHGYGDSPDAWGSNGIAIESVDSEARRKSGLRPIIYLIPEGMNSYYVNRYDGSFPYMDMLSKELVPLVDRMLRTNASREHRGVAGYSMGGFGALAVASVCRDVFSTCISLSPSLNTDEQYCTLGGWDEQWGSVFGGKGTLGSSRLTPHYRAMCPLHFFADNPERYDDVAYFIDCGDDEERLYIGSGELHSLMREKGIKHEMRVRNGAHTTMYWRQGLTEGLAFFESQLAEAGYAAEEGRDASMPEVNKSSVGSATVYTGAGFKRNDASHIIYACIGQGNTEICAEDVVCGLGSLLSSRNCALAVYSADAIAKVEDCFASVETEFLGAKIEDSRRQIVVYGHGCQKIADYAFSGARVGGFYAEDADIAVSEGARFSGRAYIVDITDMGTNHRQAFALYCKFREADAPAQYRVRNGCDTALGLRQGLASIVPFFNIPAN